MFRVKEMGVVLFSNIIYPFTLNYKSQILCTYFQLLHSSVSLNCYCEQKPSYYIFLAITSLTSFSNLTFGDGDGPNLFL